MRRACLVLSLLVSVMWTGAAPVSGVTGGEVDGVRHTNVGCMLGQRADGSFAGCGSAQLIAPDLVLIAAHEIRVLESFGATRYFVSFEPQVDTTESLLYAIDDFAVAPSFNPISFEGLDLAVAELRKKVSRVVPVQIASAGLLDDMRAAGTLDRASFTVVGYGMDCSGISPSACFPVLDTTRRFATERFLSLQRSTFAVHSGDAGPCFGDSGSPHFVGDSNVSVGVTGTVSGACTNAVPVTRLDTPEARSFLSPFGVLEAP